MALIYMNKPLNSTMHNRSIKTAVKTNQPNSNRLAPDTDISYCGMLSVIAPSSRRLEIGKRIILGRHSQIECLKLSRVTQWMIAIDRR
jgi:hypothetical protein